MHTLRSLRLPATLLIAALLAVGCDGFESGTPPTEAVEEPETTVSFAESGFSAVESSGTISIDVEVNNPQGQEVSAEILYADPASDTDPSDFNLTDSEEVGDSRVAGQVTFPADASDGDVRSIELNIQDDTPNEPRENGIFVLQQIQNATVGSNDRLTVTIGAIQVFTQDFSGEQIAPMTVFNVTDGNGWEIGTADEPNSPFVAANAFDGSEPSNSWLITPAFDFSVLEGETLSFINAKNFDDGGLQERALQVKVSTDYDGSGNPENATWTDVTDRVENFSQGGYNFVQSGDIDLSDSEFQQEEVYIAFRYQSSGTGAGSSEEQQIDNIELTSTTPPAGG